MYGPIILFPLGHSDFVSLLRSTSISRQWNVRVCRTSRGRQREIEKNKKKKKRRKKVKKITVSHNVTCLIQLYQSVSQPLTSYQIINGGTREEK